MRVRRLERLVAKVERVTKAPATLGALIHKADPPTTYDESYKAQARKPRKDDS